MGSSEGAAAWVAAARCRYCWYAWTSRRALHGRGSDAPARPCEARRGKQLVTTCPDQSAPAHRTGGECKFTASAPNQLRVVDIT